MFVFGSFTTESDFKIKISKQLEQNSCSVVWSNPEALRSVKVSSAGELQLFTSCRTPSAQVRWCNTSCKTWRTDLNILSVSGRQETHPQLALAAVGYHGDGNMRPPLTQTCTSLSSRTRGLLRRTPCPHMRINLSRDQLEAPRPGAGRFRQPQTLSASSADFSCRESKYGHRALNQRPAGRAALSGRSLKTKTRSVVHGV